jgi:5-methylcytosine-specific restriction endonuclease McrA
MEYKYKPVTLVLSREFLPLFFVKYHRAFIMSWLGKANIIENYPLEVFSIKTVNKVFYAPMVIRVNMKYEYLYAKSPNRLAIFIRDNYVCAYCGKICSTDEVTIDHIIPKSKGGKWTWENLVTACVECNRKKKDNIWKPVYVKPHKPELFELQIKKLWNDLYPGLKKFIEETYGRDYLKQRNIAI